MGAAEGSWGWGALTPVSKSSVWFSLLTAEKRAGINPKILYLIDRPLTDLGTKLIFSISFYKAQPFSLLHIST